MKYDDFKLRVKDINEKLMQSITQKQDQFLLFQRETMHQLTDNKKNAKQVLNSLEAYFQKSEEEKNNQISSFKSFITNLREELEKELVNYRKSHDAEQDKERILGTKEENLAMIKTTKKKEAHELSQRIQMLDRDCLSILKTNAIVLEEQEKAQKAKLIDIDKKMKFEVNKINEGILAPVVLKDADEKSGLANYENRQNYQNNTDIKEIRRQGILEIAKIKKKYLVEMKESELAYRMFICNHKRDNDILREEYNLQIEELKFTRKKALDELQLIIDMYDFDAYRTVFDANQTYQTAANLIIDKYQGKLDFYHDEIIKTENEKNLANFNNANNIFDKVKAGDSKQLLTLGSLKEEHNNQLFSYINDLNEFIIQIGIVFRDMMVRLFEHFWRNFHSNIRQFYDMLIFLSFSTHCYQGFDYKKHHNELLKMTQSFSKEQILRFEDFKKMTNQQFKKLLRQVKSMYQSMIVFREQEFTAINGIVEKFDQLIQNAHMAGRTFNQDAFDEVSKRTVDKATSLKQKQKEEKLAWNKDNNRIQIEHKEKIKDLEARLLIYTTRRKEESRKSMNQYQATCKAIKQNITAIKAEHKKKVNTAQREIVKNHIELIKHVETEKKTKLKIGLI